MQLIHTLGKLAEVSDPLWSTGKVAASTTQVHTAAEGTSKSPTRFERSVKNVSGSLVEFQHALREVLVHGRR